MIYFLHDEEQGRVCVAHTPVELERAVSDGCVEVEREEYLRLAIGYGQVVEDRV